MDGGKLIELGSLEELLQKYGKAVVITLNPTQDPMAAKSTESHFFPSLAEAQAHLDQLPERTGAMMRASNLEDVFVKLAGRRLD